jgi:hypothetical protein
MEGFLLRNECPIWGSNWEKNLVYEFNWEMFGKDDCLDFFHRKCCSNILLFSVIWTCVHINHKLNYPNVALSQAHIPFTLLRGVRIWHMVKNIKIDILIKKLFKKNIWHNNLETFILSS